MFTHKKMNVFVDHLKKWEAGDSVLERGRLFSQNVDTDPKVSEEILKEIKMDAEQLLKAIKKEKEIEPNQFFEKVIEKIRLNLEGDSSWMKGKKFKAKIEQDGERAVKIEILKSYMFRTQGHIYNDLEGLRK